MNEGDEESWRESWRRRWPDWQLASVFVPEPERTIAESWFALQTLWAEAAFGPTQDPARTGQRAKLGWWAEELQGWARGLRRHPLAASLRPHAVDWASLATGVAGLKHARDPQDPELDTLWQAIAQADAVLLGTHEEMASNETIAYDCMRLAGVSVAFTAAERSQGPRARRIVHAMLVHAPVTGEPSVTLPKRLALLWACRQAARKNPVKAR